MELDRPAGWRCLLEPVRVFINGKDSEQKDWNERSHKGFVGVRSACWVNVSKSAASVELGAPVQSVCNLHHACTCSPEEAKARARARANPTGPHTLSKHNVV